ncbi:hypothetical protein HNQ56_000954 [Anaerotaenia torta]|uniref:hypothetical protein n=1 Tax=Anaerotaenia torta TaxID=433293 RepID=UPI003D2195E4
MKNSVINLLEMICGAFFLAMGLLYLGKQEKNMNHLISAVNNMLLETESIYQEYNVINGSQISKEKLYAVIIGYREYPITIDGVLITAEEQDYEYYFTLIRSRFYKKQYEFDENQKIKQVDFLSMGL